MTEGRNVTLEQWQGLIGKETGLSSWLTVSQEMINAFADVTKDHQFIHIDPVAAAKTPFGGTIAHGFLTLSLLSGLGYEAQPKIEGTVMAVNYGFDKIRFINPVRAGKAIRARFVLVEIKPRENGEYQFKHAVTVEIEGVEKPALIAEWLGMIVVK